MDDALRIDKWLWTVRLYKTRTLAASMCKSGKIKLNNEVAKPSRFLKIGDQISFRTGPMTQTFLVVGFTASRVSAKLVPAYCQDLTAAAEYEKMKMAAETERPFFFTGKGRPTKRDRRKLDGMHD